MPSDPKTRIRKFANHVDGVQESAQNVSLDPSHCHWVYINRGQKGYCTLAFKTRSLDTINLASHSWQWWRRRSNWDRFGPGPEMTEWQLGQSISNKSQTESFQTLYNYSRVVQSDMRLRPICLQRNWNPPMGGLACRERPSHSSFSLFLGYELTVYSTYVRGDAMPVGCVFDERVRWTQNTNTKLIAFQVKTKPQYNNSFASIFWTSV
jgi:hypothetical protein